MSTIGLQHIVYLHGFNSSPASTKAQQFLTRVKQTHPPINVHIPQLSHWPEQAISSVLDYVDNLMQAGHITTPSQQVAFVGSSLGGFYATWLAAHYGSKAVLINPAVRPDLLLVSRLGSQRNYHDNTQTYELTRTHMEQLRHLTVAKIPQPENLLVLLQTADETLNYKDAVVWYEGCQMEVEQGGNHAYENFTDKISQIMTFVR